MKLAAMFGSSSSAIGRVAIGAVVVIAGAVVFTVFTADNVAGPEVALDVPAAEIALPNPVEPLAVEAETTPVPSPGFEAPRLDLVRVAPDGSAVIAGQTSPNLDVAILFDGAEVDLVRADATGNFVALLSLPPSDTPRVLSAEARIEGAEALAGVETILIAPFAASGPDQVAEVLATPEVVIALTTEQTPAFPEASAEASSTPLDPGSAPAFSDPAAPLTVPTIASTAPDAPSAPAVAPAPTSPTLTSDAGPTLPSPVSAAAPAVVIAGPEGLRVVQGPGEEPMVQTSVRLDTISYNAEGAVIISGRGPASADIQVFINNQPIQLGEIGPGGDWSLQLPDVDPGTYTLAIAEIAASGATASRVETPFLREDPERLASTPAQEQTGIEVITVQPGFTLWGMAENTFGDGIRYVQIFEENRDQILDPNWIFPGQIFRMPSDEPSDEVVVSE